MQESFRAEIREPFFGVKLVQDWSNAVLQSVWYGNEEAFMTRGAPLLDRWVWKPPRKPQISIELRKQIGLESLKEFKLELQWHSFSRLRSQHSFWIII